MAVVVVPDDWDAWATWGVKAKALALGIGPLGDITHFGLSDYPLLWPSVWGFSGWCSGGWEEHWSRGWAPVFMLLTAWQIVSVLRSRTGNAALGFGAAAVFISAPAVPLIASWSYAETPMWLMTTCALGRFVRWRDSGRVRDAILCGLFAAGAALTKNEGVLCIVALAVMIALSARAGTWRSLCVYLAPAVVLYGPWLFFIRFQLGLGSHATRSLALDAVSVSRAAARFPIALSTAFRVCSDIRQWGVVIPAAILLVLWVLIRGPNRLRTELILPLTCIAGPFVSLLFHETEVGWAVGASWNRFTAAVLPFILVTGLPSAARLFRQSQRVP